MFGLRIGRSGSLQQVLGLPLRCRGRRSTFESSDQGQRLRSGYITGDFKLTSELLKLHFLHNC
jgi:hypothetical protein